MFDKSFGNVKLVKESPLSKGMFLIPLKIKKSSFEKDSIDQTNR